jgi:hypothetical protein
MAFPCSDYYESSVLGPVRLRSSRLAQFQTGQAGRVPVFRSSTFVSLGGELYPLRRWRWAEESRSHLEYATRIHQQGAFSPAGSVRLVCLPRHRASRRRSTIKRRPTLTSLSRHKHYGSLTYARWGVSGTVKAALLMTLHRRHPVELCGPLPSTTLCRRAALQPPVEDQQVWEVISKS